MPGAYTFIGGQKVKVWKAEVIGFNSDSKEILPGTIIAKTSKSGLVIKTGNGAIKLVEVQFPNSKRMLSEDYLRGHNVEDDFCTNE